jgi:hypothetical protein
VDHEGRIAYKGDDSPVGLNLDGIAETLDALATPPVLSTGDEVRSASDPDDPSCMTGGG